MHEGENRQLGAFETKRMVRLRTILRLFMTSNDNVIMKKSLDRNHERPHHRL